MRGLSAMCTPKAMPNKMSLPAHPTCFGNLHLPLHTGPSGTFILKACDYSLKTRHTWRSLHGDYSPHPLRKAVRGPELSQQKGGTTPENAPPHVTAHGGTVW